MKITLTGGETVDVDPAQAHQMMNDGEAIREAVPDVDAPTPKKTAKRSAKPK